MWKVLKKLFLNSTRIVIYVTSSNLQHTVLLKVKRVLNIMEQTQTVTYGTNISVKA